jgi:hypothetical protein
LRLLSDTVEDSEKDDRLFEKVRDRSLPIENRASTIELIQIVSHQVIRERNGIVTAMHNERKFKDGPMIDVNR